MSSCTVLDLDAFERNTKAEGLGVGPDGPAGEQVNKYTFSQINKLFIHACIHLYFHAEYARRRVHHAALPLHPAHV